METAKIQKACYKSLLYHEDLKMVYFSVAMAVYFWMAIYNLLDKAQKNVKFIEQVSRIFGVCCKTIFRETISAKIKSVFLQQKKKQSFMNAITISPNNQAQMRLLVALAKEMKMEYHTVEQQRRAGLDEAIEDIEAGRVYKAESVDDMVNQIME